MANLNSEDMGSSYLILIVDDLPEVRYFKRWWLEQEGFKVAEAENGRDGVEAADRERPRLILMNYLMPEMNGLEASTIIREHPELRNIPIIMNSACPEQKMRPRALQAGCVDYFEEPGEIDNLLTKIKEHILVG